MATVSHTSHDDAGGVLGAKFDGAPGIPTSGPCGMLRDLAGPNQVRVVRPPGDQPRRRQIQRGVQLVAHADVERAGIRSAMIGDSLICPDGLMNDQSSAPRQITTAADTDATTASV